MNEKINFHKKKVSESAQKLAGILDMSDRGDLSERDEYNKSELKMQSRSVSMRRQ
jgi:hypothetical protein